MWEDKLTDLLVEGGRLETERVDNVVDLLGTRLEGLLNLLSRGVGTCAMLAKR